MRTAIGCPCEVRDFVVCGQAYAMHTPECFIVTSYDPPSRLTLLCARHAEAWMRGGCHRRRCLFCSPQVPEFDVELVRLRPVGTGWPEADGFVGPPRTLPERYRGGFFRRVLRCRVPGVGATETVASRPASVERDGPPRNSNCVWTGPEVELVASREDLSADALAQMLGRSVAAVRHVRKFIERGEPRWLYLAGGR